MLYEISLGLIKIDSLIYAFGGHYISPMSGRIPNSANTECKEELGRNYNCHN